MLSGDGIGEYSVVCAASKLSAVGKYDITIENYGNDNYQFTVTSGELTITKRPLSVVADDETVIYGTAPELTYKTNGLVNGDILTGALATDGTHVGEWAITVGTLAAGSNYETTYTAATLTITKKTLTASVKQDYTKTYGEDNPEFEYAINGFVYADDESSLTGSAQLTCAAGKYAAAGEYAIEIAGLSSDDYAITYVAKKLTVGKLGIKVTAETKTQIYGGEPVALTYVAEGLLNGDELLGALVRAVGENVGDYAITVGTLHNGNYTIDFVGANYSITPATLTITVGNVSKYYGEDNPESSYGYSAKGFKRGDTAAVLDESNLQYVTEVEKTTVAGEYSITLTGLTADNYDITVIAGVFEVSVASIHINVDEDLLDVVYDGAAKTITATAEETGEFEFTYEYDGLASAPSAAGEYAVRVIFAGDANYEATSKYFTLKISPRPITVTADEITAYYGEVKNLTYTYDLTNLLGNAFTGALTREVGDNVGEYAVQRGTLHLDNHEITFVGAKYIINPKTVTVTVNNCEKQYGDDNPSFGYVASGLLNNDKLAGSASYLTDAQKFSTTGGYAVSVSGLTASGNYVIDYKNGTLTIGKRDITVEFGANDLTYDGTELQISASLVGLVNGDTVGISFDKTLIDAGEYTVAASITSDNYRLTGNCSATVTVKQAEQIITVDKTEFGYDGKTHSIVATLTRGDGVISYQDNSFKDMGDYNVTVIASATKNYKLKSVIVAVKVTRAATSIYSVNDITIDYGDTLIDGLLSGTAKNEYGDIIVGAFAFKTQGLKPTVSQSGNFEITFMPDDDNYDGAVGVVKVTVRKIAATVTPDAAGKVIGQSDPTLSYTIGGLLTGDELSVELSRTAGETAGEYSYVILGEADNYELSLAGDAKFYIYERLVAFDYSDDFKYRMGTVGTVELRLTLNQAIDVGALRYESVTVQGDAAISATGRTATITGSGIVKLKIKIDGYCNAVFDEYVFEVVGGGKNVTALEGLSSGGNVLLHSDITVTTTGFTVATSSSVYGNDYTVDASNFNPTYNYSSVVVLQGLLENVTIIGRYADTGYNSDDTPANRYKTVQTVYMYKDAVLRNCYISGGRYAVRTGGVSNALIEDCTIANAIYNIAIMATGGAEKLTLRNVDLVEKPTGNGGEGVGAGIVFTEDKYPKNFTLRFEGNVDFHCFISKNDVSNMEGDYQTILNTLWGSAGDFKYSIGGTDYINAAIAHVKADSDDFILEYSEDCNVKDRLSYMEKSVSVASINYTGRLYSFRTGELNNDEVNALYARPASKAGAYSALTPTASGGYKTDDSATVTVGNKYDFARNTARFTKYGEALDYETSIRQTSTSVGGFETTSSAFLLEMGTYLVTYTVYDHFDEVYFTFTTRVSVMDDSPAPIIVFTYGDGKGKGTADDPFKWQGKTVGTILDPDYDCMIDVYMGIQAFDSRGNALPLTAFTITYGSSTWSNASSGVYSYKSNEQSGNPAYTSATGLAFTYKVSDVYGKTTTVTRYVKVTSWCARGSSPDNGTAPAAARVTEGYTAGQHNVGEVVMLGKGTLVICDGSNVYTQASQTATGTISNTSETHDYTYDDSVFGLTHTGTAHITITYNYTLTVNGRQIVSSTTFSIDKEYSITCAASNFSNRLKTEVNNAVASAIADKQTEFTTAGFTRMVFNETGVPVLQNS